jgi:cytochrome c biogenesis protein CcmG, thiol:disulfide interchange protein DsbE
MKPTKPLQRTPLVLLTLGFLLIIIAIYALVQDTPLPADPSAVPVQVNYPAPELTLLNTLGEVQSLDQFRGQVVLVNLWATWCPPCKKEMPALQAFYEDHAAQGFTIIAINDGDPTADVVQFAQDYQLTFPVWLDPTYIATEQAFKTLNLPSSFVIDRNGTIRLSWVGGISQRMLEKHVTPLIEASQ